MKMLLVLFILYPVFLFSGVFEHLMGKDINYLFEHRFQCSHSICLSQQNDIFDNDVMDDSIKVVKAFLDHEEKVFKIELELTLEEEKKDAFYNAIVLSKNEYDNAIYSLETINDKYGNHNIVTILDKERTANYKKFLTSEYYNAMKSYTNGK